MRTSPKKVDNGHPQPGRWFKSSRRDKMPPDALLQITDGLDRLAIIDARLSRIVEYRFFGELTNAEVGAVLGINERTVERDWIKARMLLREILVS